ncbi:MULTISPECIES: hypothetical protein [Cysteiniphilum]|uniref:hypothetical protein n=1 Tax=Cysteiniphilum TaxID=2056696 RepID=UPI000E35624A|nr:MULTISPECIES: hypothetical protein [Cysteiniphilum]
MMRCCPVKCGFTFVLYIIAAFIISVILFALILAGVGALINAMHVFPDDAGRATGYIVAVICSLALLWAYTKIAITLIRKNHQSSQCNTKINS